MLRQFPFLGAQTRAKYGPSLPFALLFRLTPFSVLVRYSGQLDCGPFLTDVGLSATRFDDQAFFFTLLTDLCQIENASKDPSVYVHPAHDLPAPANVVSSFSMRLSVGFRILCTF